MGRVSQISRRSRDQRPRRCGGKRRVASARRTRGSGAGVVDILLAGILLVFVILYVFGGHFRTAVIVALTAPVALLFTFCRMVIRGDSTNLVSLGAVDLGIIVDSALIIVESIFSHLSHKPTSAGPRTDRAGAHYAGRTRGRMPDRFRDGDIVVACIPLLTMTGMPGKIFAPMS